MMAHRILSVLKKYPITNGMAVYAVSWTLGNGVEQKLVRHHDQINWKEALRFGAYAGLYIATTQYCFMRAASLVYPVRTWKGAIVKGFVQELFYAPFTIGSFLILMSFLQGQSIESIKEEVRTKFVKTVQARWLVWTPIQTLNHAFVPSKYRVSVSGGISFIWGVFLSYVKHIENHEFDDKIKIPATSSN